MLPEATLYVQPPKAAEGELPLEDIKRAPEI
jgi:hypothetical protein